MRYLWLCGLLAGIGAAGQAQQLPRTPDGMLWAGTTFQLCAIASDSRGTPLSLSPQSSLTVGVITQWRVLHESENTATLTGSEGWFTIVVANRGNAVDYLNLRYESRESADMPPWEFAMFELPIDEFRFYLGSRITDSTALFMPGEARRIAIRCWPPGSRNTDGALLSWVGTSQRNPALSYPRDFAVGVEAPHWVYTVGWVWIGHQLMSEPVFVDGRLYWLGWDGNLLHVFRTPNPLSVATPFANNVSLVSRVRIPPPTHSTVLIGNQWYVLTQTGQIMFIPMDATQDGAIINAVPVNLPVGVTPELNLPLVRAGSLLCFADRRGRVWLYNPADSTFIQLHSFSNSNRAVTALSALSESEIAVGRSDGRVDVYRGVKPIVVNLDLPESNGHPVQSIYQREGLLTVVCGARIGTYHIPTRKWLWHHQLDSAPVTPPVYDPVDGVCYVLTENGWLYAINYQGGNLLPLYPIRLFEDGGVARAALACVARADRQVPYLYLQAQLSDASVQTMFVTARNPYNRFVNSQIPVNAPIGTRWLFTGDTDNDLALCWVLYGAGTGSSQGFIYGFRLR